MNINIPNDVIPDGFEIDMTSMEYVANYNSTVVLVDETQIDHKVQFKLIPKQLRFKDLVSGELFMTKDSSYVFMKLVNNAVTISCEKFNYRWNPAPDTLVTRMKVIVSEKQ